MSLAAGSGAVLPPTRTEYPDRRHQYARSLWRYCRRLCYQGRSEQKHARQGCVRAIVNIALYPRPLRSIGDAKRVEGVGDRWANVLKESVEKEKDPFDPPQRGKCSSMATAALLALLELEERGETLCSWEQLVQELRNRMEGNLKMEDVHILASGNIFDPGWKQVELLEGKYIKRRQRKNISASGKAFELMPEGKDLANRLRQDSQQSLSYGALRANRESVGGVVQLLVDHREGGGETHRLNELCDYLDLHRVRYQVRSLPFADFLFEVDGRLLPLLIERKSASDVAGSMNDGRWGSQQAKMAQVRDRDFGGAAQLCYIIEGTIEAARAQCACGRGCVGRCGWPSVHAVKESIDQLAHRGFDISYSAGLRQTAQILTHFAQTFESQQRSRGLASLLSSSPSTSSSTSSSAGRTTASHASSSNSYATSSPPSAHPHPSTDAEIIVLDSDDDVPVYDFANSTYSSPPRAQGAPHSDDEGETSLIDLSQSVGPVHRRPHVESRSSPTASPHHPAQNSPFVQSQESDYLDLASPAERAAAAAIARANERTRQSHTNQTHTSRRQSASASNNAEARGGGHVLGSSNGSSRTSASGASAHIPAAVSGAGTTTSSQGHPGPSRHSSTSGDMDDTTGDEAQLMSLPLSELKERCQGLGLAVSGNKEALVKRLLQPPIFLILRATGKYVPRADTANAAILVALLLHEKRHAHSPNQTPWLSKNEIMHLAEETGISKDPMCGRAAPGAVYMYDGWSGVHKYLVGSGYLQRRGRDKYALTTMPNGESGKDLAQALHQLAHKAGRCRCGNPVGGSAPAPHVGSKPTSTSSSTASSNHSLTAATSSSSAPSNHALTASSSSSSSSPSAATDRLAGSSVPSASSDVPGNAEPTGEMGDGTRKRKRVTCGKCGGVGHNSRSRNCPLFAPPSPSSSSNVAHPASSANPPPPAASSHPAPAGETLTLQRSSSSVVSTPAPAPAGTAQGLSPDDYYRIGLQMGMGMGIGMAMNSAVFSPMLGDVGHEENLDEDEEVIIVE